MIKRGIPEQAVKNQMSIDGIPQNEIDDFFTLSSKPPAPTTATAPAPSATATATAPSTTATAPPPLNQSLLQNIQKAKISDLKKAPSKSSTPPDPKPRTKPLTPEENSKYTRLYEEAMKEITKDKQTDKINKIITEMRREKISNIIINQFIEEQRNKYAIDTRGLTNRRNQIQDDSDSESDIDGQSKCVIS
jgi:hypothetical protein